MVSAVSRAGRLYHLYASHMAYWVYPRRLKAKRISEYQDYCVGGAYLICGAFCERGLNSTASLTYEEDCMSS